MTDQPKFCTGCGAAVPAGGQFCSSCGRPVGAAAVAAPVPAAAPYAPAPAAAPYAPAPYAPAPYAPAPYVPGQQVGGYPAPYQPVGGAASGRPAVPQNPARNAAAIVVIVIGLVVNIVMLSVNWSVGSSLTLRGVLFVLTLAVPTLIAAVITSADRIGRIVLAGTVVVGAIAAFIAWQQTTSISHSAWAVLGYDIAYTLVLGGWLFLKARPAIAYIALVPYLIVAALLDVPKGPIGTWFNNYPYRHWQSNFETYDFGKQLVTNAWFDIDVILALAAGLVALVLAMLWRQSRVSATAPPSGQQVGQ